MTSTAKRFRAFISYSQRDKAIARRVHKALETFRLPGGVRADGVDRSRRIGRVFRDDEEMGASADLGATLRGALEDTEALIVICSRRSAKSQWVNQEIAHFKRTGRADRIFAVIVDGAPNAVREADQCFPPALRFEVDANGAVTDKPSEPLGLDMRTQSFERLRVRLIAGLLGLPFDDLWNRDRRRRQRNTALTAVTALAILGAMSAAGAFWLQERVNRTLLEARADVGEGRISQALARLHPFANLPIAGAEPTVRSILGWASPVSEQIAAHGRPRLINYRGAVLLMDREGGLHDVSEIGGAPQRVLLARDERRFVVVGENKTLVLDASSGATLAEAENNSTTWDSYAFETPEGRLVILGVRPGSTLGAISYAVLAISADGASAQRIDLTQMVAVQALWLGDACQELIIGTRDGGAINVALPANGEVAPTTFETVPLPQTAAATLVWRIAAADSGNPYENSPFEAEAAELQNANLFVEIGCESVAADTADALDLPRVEVLQLGALSASAEGWQPIAQPPELFRPMQTPPGRDPGFWTSWRSLPTPRGVAPESTQFDAVNGTALAFIEDVGNAGVRWAVCRPNGQCAEVEAMHNEARSYEMVRSPDGAFLLLAQAGALIDLDRLEVVTGVRELPTGIGTAFDFEPGRAQLTIVDDGELVAYRPNQSGDRWTRVEEISSASLPRSDEGFAGLVAFGDGRYLIVRENGAAIRFGSDGRALWQMTYAGLGGVIGLRYSADRRYVVLVGVAGLRLIDAETGLALSGLLRPPGWSVSESDPTDCTSGVHVSNSGEVRVICTTSGEGPAATWAPRAFDGDLAARIGEILCDADTGLSPEVALRRCLER